MTVAREYAERIDALLPIIKSGTLRIWGEWFGRPHDNIHNIVEASADGDILKLTFNEGESLTVYNPDHGAFDDRVFMIKFATRVRWEWYLYGEDRSPENLRFLDYLLGPEGCTLQTNQGFIKPPDQPPTSPAVELL